MRASAFVVLVSDNQKVAEAIHSFITKRGMKIRKRFDKLIVSVSFLLEPVPEQHPVRALKVLLIQFPLNRLEKICAWSPVGLPSLAARPFASVKPA